jgi:hypothetical protein
MDIQGAEGEVVVSSVDLLTERARRFYVETHSAEVERAIRETLDRANGSTSTFPLRCGLQNAVLAP